jgi:hypothetical protein
MRDKTTVALGWFDAERMAADYELVKTYIGMDKPFDVKTALFRGAPSCTEGYRPSCDQGRPRTSRLPTTCR